jgi:hypothetical protein
MIGRSLLAACALAVAARGAAAQQPAAKPATDSVAAELLGVWEGRFSSHGPAGELRLEFTRDSVFRVKTEFLGMPFGSGTHVVALDKNSVTWSQVLMDHECKTWAVLTRGTLDGEVNCGDVTFSVKKKAK